MPPLRALIAACLLILLTPLGGSQPVVDPPHPVNGWGNGLDREPNTEFDRTSGFMWSYDVPDREQYFLDGFLVEDRLGDTATGVTGAAATSFRAVALLGEWQDCNEDGYMGSRATASLEYPTLLWHSDSCYGKLNGGTVRELTWVEWGQVWADFGRPWDDPSAPLHGEASRKTAPDFVLTFHRAVPSDLSGLDPTRLPGSLLCSEGFCTGWWSEPRTIASLDAVGGARPPIMHATTYASWQYPYYASYNIPTVAPWIYGAPACSSYEDHGWDCNYYNWPPGPSPGYAIALLDVDELWAPVEAPRPASPVEPVPPGSAAEPVGPTNVTVGVSNPYCTRSQESGTSAFRYTFDWGDGHYDDTPYGTDNQACLTHAWDVTGDFCVKARIEDEYANAGPWSSCLVVHASEIDTQRPPPTVVHSAPMRREVGDRAEACALAVHHITGSWGPAQYVFDWGDGQRSTANPWDFVACSAHSWALDGVYCIRVRVETSLWGPSDWSPCWMIVVGIVPLEPAAPSQPTGPQSSTRGRTETYCTSSRDPHGLPVQIEVSWGDASWGTTVTGLSGEPTCLAHTWELGGTFCVQARAWSQLAYYNSDVFGIPGEPSPWGPCLWVTVA